ncbi:DUF357 domain-containing protein [Methanoregula sp.]|uniref:DUF357 domain-containing protein n=1 Tax=Methanoregula sp. TaxID=2052170 RepID=UPI002C34BA1B|nr:DUF357 domain-containing protein [Methanoregula sp.]HVP97076.1 DUF357 domain-containing protein [Methanoregula sp.]
MLIAQCGTLLSRDLDSVTIVPPEGTPLAALAVAIKGMARAYADDGATFLISGDQVNAHAAFFYGFGWLHFGLAYGLLSGSGNVPACPFAGPAEKLSPAHAARLGEKTHRYARLLDTACASVTPAPEPETAGGRFARSLILIGTCYARGGKATLATGAEEEALARFSYGHGWLDAGVRAGLLVITGNREIFTI